MKEGLAASTRIIRQRPRSPLWLRLLRVRSDLITLMVAYRDRKLGLMKAEPPQKRGAARALAVTGRKLSILQCRRRAWAPGPASQTHSLVENSGQLFRELRTDQEALTPAQLELDSLIAAHVVSPALAPRPNPPAAVSPIGL